MATIPYGCDFGPLGEANSSTLWLAGSKWPSMLTIVTNVTDQPLFGQEDYPIWPQLSDAL